MEQWQDLIDGSDVVMLTSDVLVQILWVQAKPDLLLSIGCIFNIADYGVDLVGRFCDHINDVVGDHLLQLSLVQW